MCRRLSFSGTIDCLLLSDQVCPATRISGEIIKSCHRQTDSSLLSYPRTYDRHLHFRTRYAAAMRIGKERATALRLLLEYIDDHNRNGAAHQTNEEFREVYHELIQKHQLRTSKKTGSSKDDLGGLDVDEFEGIVNNAVQQNSSKSALPHPGTSNLQNLFQRGAGAFVPSFTTATGYKKVDAQSQQDNGEAKDPVASDPEGQAGPQQALSTPGQKRARPEDIFEQQQAAVGNHDSAASKMTLGGGDSASIDTSMAPETVAEATQTDTGAISGSSAQTSQEPARKKSRIGGVHHETTTGGAHPTASQTTHAVDPAPATRDRQQHQNSPNDGSAAQRAAEKVSAPAIPDQQQQVQDQNITKPHQLPSSSAIQDRYNRLIDYLRPVMGNEVKSKMQNIDVDVSQVPWEILGETREEARTGASGSRAIRETHERAALVVEPTPHLESIYRKLFGDDWRGRAVVMGAEGEVTARELLYGCIAAEVFDAVWEKPFPWSTAQEDIDKLGEDIVFFADQESRIYGKSATINVVTASSMPNNAP